jgi:glycine cleavage system H protein
MTVILVVGTILLFLGLDWMVRIRKQDHAALVERRVVEAHSARVRMPGGVFFSRSHTWLNMFPSGKVLVGVDDFVNRLVDDPKVTLLKRTGERVVKGDPIMTLTTEGHSLTVRSPIDGEILAPNTSLVKHPELMRESLFSEGWAYAMKPVRPSELKHLLLGEETRRWIQDEFARLRDVFAGAGALAAPALLQDGGPPVKGAMTRMDQQVWLRFEEEFLQVR